MVIVLAICLLILIVNSKYILNAIIAIVCVGVSMVLIIVIMFSKQWWQFGAVESVFIVAGIGLSVGNVGLLGYGYSCSHESTRRLKMD
jgi:hypothetical protein